MEVFMRNLPRDLTEDGLQTQLEPFMTRLGIVDYLCEKPRRKPFGNVTFLHRRDGQNFLNVHGQDRPSLKSKLQLMGTQVLCTLSNRPPQDFALKSLQHTVEQREQLSQEVKEEEPSISFNLLSFSCGYCTFVGDQLAYVPEVQWQERGIVRFTKRNMIIKLNNKNHIRIPLNTVVELVWFRDGSLTLTLSEVPIFFSSIPSIEVMMAQLYNTNLNGKIWNTAEANRSRLCALGEKHAEVIGRCLVYQFHVLTDDLSRKIEGLKKREITITRHDLATQKTHMKDLGDFPTQLHALRKELADYTQNNSLPFGVLFQLQALAYNAYLHPVTVLGLAKELRRIMKVDQAAGKSFISVDAMRKLFDMIDWPSPHGNPMDFEVSSLVAALKQNGQEIQDGFEQRAGLFGPTANMARINRVMITPTRITLHGPEMEPNNRILRKFPNHHEHFIRAQFCDENGQDLYFNTRISYDDIYARFKLALKHGIQIAGRMYKFLGFSHSSLRSHSVWFYSPFVDDNGHMQTYFTIIEALGNFSRITSPARCAARIGQAFSETPFAVPLGENKIVVTTIPDVRSPDGSRIFSDGVGTISWDVMETIRDNLTQKKGSPTCFQIRLGGAKGMLAVDSRLSGSFIQLRPSMIKFDSEDMQDLGICDMASKPILLVLNRQMIKILEDMGVSDDWFFKLQNTELARLRGITANIHNTANFLKAQNIGDSIRLHKLFRQCELLGIDCRKDEFLRSVVEAVVLRELRLLKHKARIPVKKGITLFGIMDETGFLQEKEVYVTFNTMDRYPPPPGPGRLLVTRSPALYDGDIQFANNVVPPKDHPLLEHRNCIVFSQKGNRDLPSQLSGGDLDGDLYNVIWDTDARPIQTFAPADYPRVSPIDIGRAVNVNDMADFFVDFMRTDHLGVIATRHMILADQKEMGTRHPDCKKLAELHSTAVDFSKTGIAVKMEELPRTTNNFRPDFLAPGPQAHIHDKSEIELDQYVLKPTYDEDEDDTGPPRKYYKSEKILGKLYRAIDERKIWYENVRSKFEPGGASFWDQFIHSCTERCNVFGEIMWTRRIEEAWRIRSAYEDAILSTMNNFSEHPIKPISELEVFIGYIINKTGVQTRRQRERSLGLKDEFDRIATWITSQMRPHGDDIVPVTGYETELDALGLCLACVFIGGKWKHPEATRRRRGGYGELKSFRAIAASALLAELDLFERGEKGGG